MWNYLRHSLRIRRIEYRIAELPLFTIPVLLTIRETHHLRSPVFWEGLIAFLFLFAFGDLLNCFADCELDRKHKPHLSESVDYLGKRGVLLQAVLSAVGALAFTLHVAWMTSRWLLPPMMAVGLLLAAAYSVEPLRLKKRGLWQLAFYWLGLFVAPMVFAACLFTQIPSLDVILVAVAFGCVQTGVLLVNTAEDYPEDLEMNVSTVIVHLGLRRGVQWGAVLALSGALLLLTAFVSLQVSRQGWSVAVFWHAPLAVALVYCVVNVGCLSREIQRPNLTESRAIEIVKRAATRVPIWMSSIAMASLISAIAVFRS